MTQTQPVLARLVTQLRETYYGWWVVAAIFVTMTTTSGVGFYNLSVLLGAFTETRFDVAEVSGATSLYFLASGFGGMVFGRLIERFNIRYVMALSGLLGALVFLFGCKTLRLNDPGRQRRDDNTADRQAG